MAAILLKRPPPVWALIYMLADAALSWALGWPLVPGLPQPALGIVLIAIAFIPAIWSFRLFRRAGTEVNPTSPENHALVIEGPYRLTRNPMYLGMLTLTLGVAVLIGAWPMLLAPVAFFATVDRIHIPFEEAKMRRQFATQYDDYLRRVRRWV